MDAKTLHERGECGCDHDNGAWCGYIVSREWDNSAPATPGERGAREDGFPEHVTLLVLALDGWASIIAARYGHAAYLVGSALVKPDARDVDVRVVLPDDEWEARFGGSARAFNNLRPPRYVDEIGKLSRQVSSDYRLNVDFQVQPASHVEQWGYDVHPRVLLAAAGVASSQGREREVVEGTHNYTRDRETLEACVREAAENVRGGRDPHIWLPTLLAHAITFLEDAADMHAALTASAPPAQPSDDEVRNIASRYVCAGQRYADGDAPALLSLDDRMALVRAGAALAAAPRRES